MWCIIVIITCVGYGEIYPVTHIGRIFGATSAIIGNLLLAVMVVSLTYSSEFTA